MLKKTCLIILCISLVSIICPTTMTLAQNGDIQQTISSSSYNTDSYVNYAAGNSDKKPAKETIELNCADAKINEYAKKNFAAGGCENVIELKEEGSAEWEIFSNEDALYSICFNYYPLKGSLSNIEIMVEIDGKTPFKECESINLSRIWKTDGKITRDNNDNDIRANQIEDPKWLTEYASDKNGYTNDVFAVYLSKGAHKIKITMMSETIALKDIILNIPESIVPYSEIQKKYEGIPVIKNYQLKVQAEETTNTSHSMIYATEDRGSPGTQPSDPVKIRLNTIGGMNWDQGGQWASWKFEVAEDGLYQINIKYRQNDVLGFATSRKMFIDNTVSFKELEQVDFEYTSGSKWANKTLGSNDRIPYLFYLTKGVHELKLEVISGKTGKLLYEVNDIVYKLNELYRKIIMITGTIPDTLRDYYLEQEIPELIPSLKEQSTRIRAVYEKFNAVSTDKKGSQVSFMLEVAHQLESFIEKPETIQIRLSQLQNNISSLANLNLSLKNQPLEIDYFTITGSENELEKVNATFFNTVVFRARAFIASFFEDYNAVGNTYESNAGVQKPLEVWVSSNDLATSGYASGRDQMTVIKRLIDDEFVAHYGQKVNLKLVDSSSTLTQAILAKKGPDIAIVVPSQTPINLAMRDAIVDLSKLEGFNDMKKEFFDSAFIPYEFNGGTYGMPETQVFWMMFCREDILSEIGVLPPDTWEDFYKAANLIMKNHLEIGIPENLQIFETFLMQNGATLYNDNQTATNLNTQEAINAFTEWTNIYANYSFPIYFDSYSRFRTGEMPIVFMPYSFYNQLVVGAPEIANMWKILPLPGRMVNSEMSRISSSSGTGAIILKDAEAPEKCFEFIKWWVSADIQARFGNEIESVLGPSARYNTANTEAFRQLSWTVKEQKLILEQWEDVSAVYNVPGNYYVSRCLTNAFRRVVMYYENPRETLLKYNVQINTEITRKRFELGLPAD